MHSRASGIFAPWQWQRHHGVRLAVLQSCTVATCCSSGCSGATISLRHWGVGDLAGSLQLIDPG